MVNSKIIKLILERVNVDPNKVPEGYNPNKHVLLMTNTNLNTKNVPCEGDLFEKTPIFIYKGDLTWVDRNEYYNYNSYIMPMNNRFYSDIPKKLFNLLI